MDNTMAEALRQAGVQTAKQRLEALADQAIAEMGGVPERVIARFVGALLDRPDAAALIWELFEPQRTARLYQFIAARIGAERSRRGAGQRVRDTHITVARPAAGANAIQPARGQLRIGTHADGAPAPVGPAPAPPRREAGMQAVLALGWRTLRINGQSIFALTREEATVWCGKRETETRFVRLMAEQVPDGGRIGDYLGERDADALWRLAEGAANG